MRGVILMAAAAVVIELLLVGIVYAAQATAEAEAPFDSSLLFAVERREVDRVNLLAQESQQQRQQVEHQRQQIELKRQDAVNRFGPWGPILIEAGEAHGQNPDDLYRVMMCESRGDPAAENGIVQGLFQFNPGTWASTPYAGESIWDPHAQALATAWMWSQGRKGEWVCV